MYVLEVKDACKYLRRKVVVNDLVVEREKLSLNMQPEKQSKKVVEQPQLEKYRGDRVEESTQEETSSRGKFQVILKEGAHASIHLDERLGNVQK